MILIATRSERDFSVMRMPWGWMLVVAAIFGAVLCGFWIAQAHHRVVSGICLEWDVNAKRALAPAARTPKLMDQQLLDALATLRRARHNCAAGRLDLARRDYEAVRTAYGLPMSAVAHD